MHRGLYVNMPSQTTLCTTIINHIHCVITSSLLYVSILETIIRQQYTSYNKTAVKCLCYKYRQIYWRSRYSDGLEGRGSNSSSVKNFPFSRPAMGSTQPRIQWVPQPISPDKTAMTQMTYILWRVAQSIKIWNQKNPRNAVNNRTSVISEGLNNHDNRGNIEDVS
jgi:hypothetical protein